MQINLCDRCEKETESIHTVSYYSLTEMRTIRKELCGDCFETFINWIENRQEESALKKMEEENVSDISV